MPKARETPPTAPLLAQLGALGRRDLLFDDEVAKLGSRELRNLPAPAQWERLRSIRRVERMVFAIRFGIRTFALLGGNLLALGVGIAGLFGGLDIEPAASAMVLLFGVSLLFMSRWMVRGFLAELARRGRPLPTAAELGLR